MHSRKEMFCDIVRIVRGVTKQADNKKGVTAYFQGSAPRNVPFGRESQIRQSKRRHSELDLKLHEIFFFGLFLLGANGTNLILLDL